MEQIQDLLWYFMSLLLSRDLLMCCLCDLYIKADCMIILTQQRKDLDWKVLSAYSEDVCGRAWLQHA